MEVGLSKTPRTKRLQRPAPRPMGQPDASSEDDAVTTGSGADAADAQANGGAVGDGANEESVAAATGLTGAPVPPPTVEAVEFDPTRTTSGGRFPPLNDPRAVLPAEATWLDDETLVLGAIQNGDARAYPVYMMTFHYVSNDVLGGQPYLVSF